MKIKNINPNIFSFLMMFAAILFLTAVAAVAQSEKPMPEQTSKDVNAVESNSCSLSRTFAYSSGEQRFAFCISEHGNIENLEFPSGYKHIGVREGYALCSGSVPLAYDAGITGDGWGPVTITQPGGAHTLPLTITRQTTDGKFELQQTFDWNKTEKEIFITMALKNISASSVAAVALARYFDADMNNDAEGDYFDRGPDSVWGRQGSESHRYGLALTALSFNYVHAAYTEFYDDWTPYGKGHDATTCYPDAEVGGLTGLGDYVGRLTYKLGTFGPGATKTVKMIYRRF